jgi:hypothetical protein
MIDTFLGSLAVGTSKSESGDRETCAVADHDSETDGFAINEGAGGPAWTGEIEAREADKRGVVSRKAEGSRSVARNVGVDKSRAADVFPGFAGGIWSRV